MAYNPNNPNPLQELAAEAPMARYMRYLQNGELGYQFSLAAQKPFFYPRIVCPYSGTTDFEWRVSAGRGEIYAVTYLYPRDEAAYAVVLIDIDEGFRLMSRILDAAIDTVRIGCRVQVKIRPGENGDNAPFFVLDPAI